METLLSNYKKEGMNLRFQKSMGQLEKPSRIKFVRREIARIKTILNLQEKKLMPKRVLNGTVCSATNTKPL